MTCPSNLAGKIKFHFTEEHVFILSMNGCCCNIPKAIIFYALNGRVRRRSIRVYYIRYVRAKRLSVALKAEYVTDFVKQKKKNEKKYHVEEVRDEKYCYSHLVISEPLR